MLGSDAGFAVFPAVISGRECDALLAALANLPRSRAGARHLMAHAQVAKLAADVRLIDIATGVLGGCATPFRATLFDKSQQANWLVPWHQDTALPLTGAFDAPDWGPWSSKNGVLYAHAPTWALRRVVALRLHLDASTTGNGPLQVIPHSHLAGVLSDDAVAEYAAKDAPFRCVVPRGGVLAMRPLLIHASSKAISSEPRRVLHIEYASSLDLAPGVRLAVA